MRLIEPPRDQLDRLRTPLTAGERRVLDFFDETLDQAWEIYIQPHLNGLRPDFVLLNPHAGIAVFEVKDWNLAALGYHWRDGAVGKPALWATDRHGQGFRVADDPITKVDEYRDALAELHCPAIGYQALRDHRIRSLITAGVIMTECSTETAREFFDPAREARGMLFDRVARYYPLAGGEALVGRRLTTVFPEALRCQSAYMTPQLADDLRAWLIEPTAAAEQRRPLKLDKRQKDLATSRTSTGYRRIRGPAGSGKSLILAARAGDLTADHQDVLVVSFNLTLWHWLHDLAVRYPVPDRRLAQRSTWTHFHEWCRRLCYLAGWEDQYKGLFEEFSLSDVLDLEMPNLARRAVAHLRGAGSAAPWSFDAILVDEGQDFRLEWWSLLRQCLRDGGEMVLVADRAQDVYERADAWTEEAMSGAGFSGAWNDLTDSYRLPDKIIRYARSFLEQFAPDELKSAPAAVQEPLPGFCNLRWVQVDDPADVCARCVDELTRIPQSAELGRMAIADLHLLVPNHQLRLQCVDLLERRGIHCCHTFGRDHAEQKPRKLAFWAGDAALKACTIHSFKGWEARAIVVCIAAEDVQSRALYYVALTRLKQHDLGCYLTVVCADPTMAEFGAAWPEFERAEAGSWPWGSADQSLR
ncbi:MAG: NERD domain-containing protein [Fimbriimonadaceae bacterium]|nr:NERD domain-containing protein [Fimbriimonadaceae bacterium]